MAQRMTLTFRLLGLELLHVEISTDDAEPDDDTARDLSGGNLTSERIDRDGSDLYLGFTNGRGDGE